MKYHGGSIRLLVAGAIAAGGAFVPAALAGAQDCSAASPSNTTCGPPEVESNTATANTRIESPSEGRSELAFTGSDSVTLAAVAAGAIAVGSGTLVLARRRSR